VGTTKLFRKAQFAEGVEWPSTASYRTWVLSRCKQTVGRATVPSGNSQIKRHQKLDMVANGRELFTFETNGV